MTAHWEPNVEASRLITTEQLVDDDRMVMVNVSPLPDGTHVVSLSKVIVGTEAEAKALGERLFALGREATR